MKSGSVLSFVLALLAAPPACVQAQAAPPAPSEQAAPALPIVYRNSQYGFCFRLPASWRGYSVLTRSWSGSAMDNSGKSITGPELVLRNPNWTEAVPWEDIPIMIFTPAQWKHAANGGYTFGAAPIGPGEMAHNRRYVFALPARWNFDLANGFEEANQLIQDRALQAPCAVPRAGASMSDPSLQ